MHSASGARAARGELAARLGVSEDSLHRLTVGIGNDGGGDFTSWPERDASGRIIGIVRRYRDGSKLHCAGGSAGLYIASGWDSAAGPILLPEGGSDVASLLSMGLAAVGRPSCTGGVDHLARLLQRTNRPIVVLGENDFKPHKLGTVASCPSDCDGCSWCFPGRYGARTTAEKLTSALGRVVHWRMVRDAKDSREWLNRFGCNGEAFVEMLRQREVHA